MDKTTSFSTENKKEYLVSGQVFNSKSEPVMGQGVLAVDVDLRGAAVYNTVASFREIENNKGFQLLGAAKTDADGFYQIIFDEAKFKRNEMGFADVICFAIDDEKITARSRLSSQSDYLKNQLLHWDIYLADATKRGISEYAKLIQVIEPFTSQSELHLSDLSDSADQVSFLATETNQDPGHTALAVQADNLCSDYPKSVFSRELFYGLGRQNIALTWASLLVAAKEALNAAILQSIDQNIIGPQGQDAIDAFIKEVLATAAENATTATGTAHIFKTIGISIKEPVQQLAFLQSYLQFKGAPADFWKSLTGQKDFPPETIASLQLTNQLSLITGRHTDLIDELQVNKGIKNVADLFKLTPDDWNAAIVKTGVPASAPGDTPAEKAAAYIGAIQNVLNTAFPTVKIAAQIAANQVYFKDANVKEKVSAFLSSAASFDFGSSRVSDFDAAIKQVAGDLHDQVVDSLETIQRIFQVSPTPETMATLIKRGYTSAHHISSVPQATFLQSETGTLGGSDVAFSVYNRARFQVMLAQYTLLRVRDTQDKATPGKIFNKAQQQALLTKLNAL